MPLEAEELGLPGVKKITPTRFSDTRGFFSETYNKKAFAEIGIDVGFVQDNHAHSADRHTLRGLHFQVPPWAQDKLVRVARGAILDVVVDIRAGSPTYGQYTWAEISATAWNQIFIPAGFAHGLLTLQPETDVIYKVSNYYAPDHDAGIFWADPDLGIDWGVREADVLVSQKDSRLPNFSETPTYFRYDDEVQGS